MGQEIIWDNKLETGIEIIDRDHKVLVDLLNQVADVVGDSEEHAVMGSVLNSLAEYTRYHFSREEKLQEVAGYPGLDAHRRRHAVLAAQVDDIRSRYRDDAASVRGDEVQSFLRGWLVEHILKEDMNYQAICAAHPEAIAAASAIKFGDEPVEGAANRNAPRAAAVNWSSLRILVVEDNRNFQLIISTILRSLGVRSITAADSGEAALASLKGGGVFDLVLSDWRMAEMDGVEFVRAARERGVTTPIIMMTGYSDSEVRERADQAGVDAFLEKPITARGFLETATAVLNVPA